jgi:hypothetical protein
MASGIKIECEYAMLMEICCRRNDIEMASTRHLP